MKAGPLKFRSRESGAGLIDALMALGVLSIGIVVLMNMINQVSNSRRAVELKAEANLLKKNLLNSTDCKAVPACQGQELRALTDFDGDVLVNSSGTSKAGAWTVQARCQADKSLEVRVALLNSKGDALKDPLRGKVMDWQAPEGVLIEAGILCGILNQAAGTQNLVVRTSPTCEAAQGSCPAPPESSNDPKASKTMCCDDGRDAVKPLCPVNTVEMASYWDRQDDWGMSGHWIVLCQ